MAESEGELKSLLTKEGEEKSENATFKEQRSWHLVPSLHDKLTGKTGNSVIFHFLGFRKNAGGDCGHEIKRHFSLEENLQQT